MFSVLFSFLRMLCLELGHQLPRGRRDRTPPRPPPSPAVAPSVVRYKDIKQGIYSFAAALQSRKH